MTFTKLQQRALITRDAHTALLNLKNLVDTATEQIRVAERESVGIAIGRHQDGEDPLKTLQTAAETFRSPNFEAAVSAVREKMDTAVSWHLGAQEAAAGA
jgi:hypothetical protein